MDSDALYWVTVVSRWVHVGTAIVIVGGSVFMRFVLLPAAGALPETEHLALRRGVMDRWRKIVHIGILLFLLSGFYNYFTQMRPHRGDGLYHGLVGTKIILALIVFALAEILAGRSASAERMRQKSKTWLGVILTLAALIVGISGFLKVRGLPPGKVVAPAGTAERGIPSNSSAVN